MINVKFKKHLNNCSHSILASKHNSQLFTWDNQFCFRRFPHQGSFKMAVALYLLLFGTWASFYDVYVQ